MWVGFCPQSIYSSLVTVSIITLGQNIEVGQGGTGRYQAHMESEDDKLLRKRR